MNNEIFDTKKINERIQELKNLPKFTPEPDEMRFTATQKYGDTEATISFVIRNGEMYFYDSKTTRINEIKY